MANPSDKQKEDVLKRAKLALDRMVERARNDRNEEDRKFLVSKIGEDLATILVPLLEKIASNARLSKEDISGLINEIRTEISKVQIEIPELKIPEIIVPEPKVTVKAPDVIVPTIKIPDIVMPDEMNVKGWVSLMGVDLNNPLPVQLRDANGNPVNLFENLTQIVSGGGGFAKTVKVTNTVPITAGESLIVNQLSGANWSVSVADTMTVNQVSGAVNSVNILQVAGTATAVNSGVANDGTLRVVHVTDVGMSVTATATDLDIRDLVNASDSVSAYQVSGASWSVNVGTVTVTATDLDTRDLVNATDSISAYQVSGASWSVSVLGTVPVSATDLDIRDLTNATDSVRVYQLSGAAFSVVANANSGVDIGDVDVTSVVPGTGATSLGKAEDAVHASADVGVMALSVRNSTNTTFAADGDYAPIATDGIGRPIIRPVQTRGLLQTAYVSITGGTETTLLAGVAGIYFDLIYVMATNNSDVAVTVDLRSASGGGIITAIRIPANGTAGVSLTTPLPQDAAADTWTIDMPDISGTTVTMGALFSREV